MKGLLRNNFYTIEATLKASLAVSAILFLIGIFIATQAPDMLSGVSSISIGTFGSFSGIPYTLAYSNHTSKWNKFELTTPVSKRDVIKSRYIIFSMFALTAIAIVTAILITLYTIIGRYDTENFLYSLTYGCSFFMILTSIVHPLVLAVGVDKGQGMFMISIVATLIIISGVLFLSHILEIFITFIDQNWIFIILILTVSVIAFIASYFISAKIYAKKDL